MVKKIIYFLIAVLILPSSVYANSAPDVFEESNIYEEAVMLTALEIFELTDDGGFQEDAYLTRGETAKIATRIFNLPPSSSTQPFDDVDSEHKFAKYIAACKESGIMNGMGNNMFEPDSYMTAKQLNALVVRMLGYENLAQMHGGFSAGYDKVGQMLDISKHLKQKGEYISRAEAAQFIYVALEAPVMQFTEASGNEITYSPEGGKTLAEAYMGIVKIEGTVTGNDISAMPGGNTTIRGNVEVAGNVMGAGNTNIRDELGKYVTVYVELENDGTYGDVQAYVVNPEYNKDVEIKARDIDILSTDADSITAVEDGKSKHYKLEDNVVIIYNGQVLTSYPDTIFDINIGELHILDTKDTDGYGVVIVKAPIPAVFSGYNDITEKMYFKYGTQAIEFEEDNYEVYIDGQKSKLENLSEWMGLYIYKPQSVDYYTICASSKTIAGNCTAMSNETLTIDDTEYLKAYELDTFLQQSGTLHLGERYTFIFNPYGDIMAVTDGTVDASIKYAYMYNIYSNDEEEVYIRLYDQNNKLATYKVREKLTLVNGSTYSKEVATNLLNIGSNFVDIGGRVIPQLVKFKLNSNNEVVQLNIALDNTGTDTYNADEFSKDYACSGTSNIRYYNGMLGGRFSVDNDSTLIFQIPADVSNNQVTVDTSGKNAWVSKSSAVKLRFIYNCEIYDIDKMHTAGVVVYYGTGTLQGSDWAGRLQTAVIDEISVVLTDEGEVGTSVSYYEDGKHYTKVCDNSLVTMTLPDGQWNDYTMVPVNELKPGDFVQIKTLDGDPDKIEDVHLLARPEDVDTSNERVTGSTITTPDNVVISNIHTYTGRVTEVSDTKILVSTRAGNGMICERAIKRNSTLDYYLFDGKKVQICDAEEVSVGDGIIVRQYDWNPYTVLVIR